MIRIHFKDKLVLGDGTVEASSSTWDRRAKKRKMLIDKYLWDQEKGMYFDYDTVLQERSDYESATMFWTMWAGVASPAQAAKLMADALPKFEEFEGIVPALRNPEELLDCTGRTDSGIIPMGGHLSRY